MEQHSRRLPKSRLPDRLSCAVIFVGLTLTWSRLSEAQALPPTLQIAHQRGDMLTLESTAIDVDLGKSRILFTGTSKAVEPRLLSSDGHMVTVQIPSEAKSGPVQLEVENRIVGSTDVRIVAKPTEVRLALNAFFNQLNASFLSYLVALAGLGTLTMALVQALKTVFPVKRVFHQWRLRKWLGTHVLQANVSRWNHEGINSTVPPPVGEVIPQPERSARSRRHDDNARRMQRDSDVKLLETAIIAVGADGDRGAFYGSESEDLFRQLTGVAQLAIDYPSSYAELITVFAARVTKADFNLLLGVTTSPNVQDRTDAIRRIRQQTLQGIVALQLKTEMLWQNAMRAASFVVSFALAFVAVRWSSGTISSPLGIAITAMLAAFLAPVARDLVAALEKARS